MKINKITDYISDHTHIILRTIGFFIFFAGESDRSKRDLHKTLNLKTKHCNFIYFLIALFICLVITASFGPFISKKLFNKTTTFNVSAITEEVNVVTPEIPISMWPVKNVLLSKSCPDESKKVKYVNFNGSFSINSNVEITFNRIAFGELTVSLFNNKNTSVGDLYDEEDEFISSLTHCAFFHIRNIPKRTLAGETIVLPISGDVSVGNKIRFLTHNKTPILRSGQVTILDRSLFIGDYYSLGPFTLEAGDSFNVQETTVPSQGFVSINEDAAMNLVYKAEGFGGVIKRYQSEDYDLENSYWSKLYHDEALSLLWILIIILFNIIRIYLRYLVN